MNQEWFEMSGILNRKLDTAVWIPLRASQTIESVGRDGFAGCRKEFFGAGSIAVPLAQKAIAETLTWMDIGIARGHKGWVDGETYRPADSFTRGGVSAVALVLEQDGNSDEQTEWHLHQDIVVTLGLKREGDSWLAMNEGYLEVARLTRSDRSPILLEIRAEHFKDYLCAREMALYVTSYRDRQEVVIEASHINWAKSLVCRTLDSDRWEGRLSQIYEGGHPIEIGRAHV